MFWRILGIILTIPITGIFASCSSGSGMFKSITIELTGSFSWNLLLHVNNSNNDGFILRRVKYQVTNSYSYSNLERELKDSIIGGSVSASADVSIKRILNVGVGFDLGYEVRSMYEKITSFAEKNETQKITSYTVKVGPYSTQSLYQLVFSGPGLSFTTDTLSTKKAPKKDVIISVDVAPRYFLRNIEIFYTSDEISRPKNLICEVQGKSPDINFGFKGDRVWLVARWTTNPKEAATGIGIAIQNERNSYFEDLAQGAGGQYRYIKMYSDSFSTEKIGNVGLFRTKQPWKKPTKYGWEFMSDDINDGRGGDYLYLCWNVVHHNVR